MPAPKGTGSGGTFENDRYGNLVEVGEGSGRSMGEGTGVSISGKRSVNLGGETGGTSIVYLKDEQPGRQVQIVGQDIPATAENLAAIERGRKRTEEEQKRQVTAAIQQEERNTQNAREMAQARAEYTKPTTRGEFIESLMQRQENLKGTGRKVSVSPEGDVIVKAPTSANVNLSRAREMAQARAEYTKPTTRGEFIQSLMQRQENLKGTGRKVIVSPSGEVIVQAPTSAKVDLFRAYEMVPEYRWKQTEKNGKLTEQEKYEKAVYDLKERDDKFYGSEGFKRISNVADTFASSAEKTYNLIPFNWGKLLKTDLFRKTVKETVEGAMSFPIAMGGYIPSTATKLYLAGRGIKLGYGKEISQEFKRAAGEAALVYTKPSTYTTAALFAVVPAAARVLKGTSGFGPEFMYKDSKIDMTYKGYESPKTKIEQTKVTSKEGISVLEIEPDITYTRQGKKVSPETYLNILKSEGKIKVEYVMMSEEQLGQINFNNDVPVISLKMGLGGEPLQKTIAHELIHYSTPAKILKLKPILSPEQVSDYLSYRSHPAEILAHGFAGHKLKTGFSVSKERINVYSQQGQERVVITKDPYTIKYPRQRVLLSETKPSAKVILSKGIVKIGSKSYDVTGTQVGRRYSGMMRGKHEDIYISKTEQGGLLYRTLRKERGKSLLEEAEQTVSNNPLILRETITPYSKLKFPFKQDETLFFKVRPEDKYIKMGAKEGGDIHYFDIRLYRKAGVGVVAKNIKYDGFNEITTEFQGKAINKLMQRDIASKAVETIVRDKEVKQTKRHPNIEYALQPKYKPNIKIEKTEPGFDGLSRVTISAVTISAKQPKLTTIRTTKSFGLSRVIVTKQFRPVEAVRDSFKQFKQEYYKGFGDTKPNIFIDPFKLALRKETETTSTRYKVETERPPEIKPSMPKFDVLDFAKELKFKSGTSPRALYSSELRTPSIIKTKTPAITETKTLTISETKTPTITETKTPTISETKTPTITETKTPTISETKTPTITETKTPTISETITPTKTHTETPTKNIITNQDIIKIPRPVPVNFGDFGFSGQKNKNLFSAEVRRGGKFIEIGDYGSIGEAFKAAETKVKTTAAASLRVKGPSGFILGSFGLSDREFTRSTKEHGVYIQKREKRISSYGELQDITFKGIASRMAYSNKKGGLFGNKRAWKSGGIFK